MTDNVYKKLAKARTMLDGVKKSGRNNFSKFNYFQLEDFLPRCNEIFDELGLCSVFTFAEGGATLSVVDSDTGTAIDFHSPVAEAGIKGASPIQQLGGVHTYMRRYMWLMAMEITEADTIDALPEEKKTSTEKISISMINQVKMRYTDEEIASMLKRKKLKTIEDLTMDDAFVLVEHRPLNVDDKTETF